MESSYIKRVSSSEEESEHGGEGGGVAVEIARPKLKEPAKYAVLLHNDDYTTMEFVVEVLQRFFHLSEEEAMKIMLQVHHAGKGVAGIFTHQVAETKIMQVHQYARSTGHPLKCSMEPA